MSQTNTSQTNTSQTNASQTDAMSQLPPPPPGAQPTGDTSPPDVSWSRVVPLLKRWYQPLLERPGWIAALYLFVGMLSAIGFSMAVMAVGATVFGLTFAGIGILLIRPFFAMVATFANAERSLAAWVGEPIEPRPMKPIRGLGFNALTDPERWRQVGYLVLNLLLGLILANVGLAAYMLVPEVVTGDGTRFDKWLFDVGAFAWLLSFTFGLLALGAAPRIALFTARLKAQITGWMLGPDRLAEAEQRVTDLSTQRRDILEAVALERRRIERNLHDGVQQQLVAIGLDLGMAEQAFDTDPVRAHELVTGARRKVQSSIGELRQLGRGLHPAILEDRGLDAALSAVIAGAPIPVSIHVEAELDTDPEIAATLYFVANEAIANVLKHAKARVASVHVVAIGSFVRLTVHDDGRGGADATAGSGLSGINARVRGVDGTFSISSPRGGPTTLVAEMPRHRYPIQESPAQQSPAQGRPTQGRPANGGVDRV